MNVKRKLADFIVLEDAKGNGVKLAGMGAATAASLLVSTLVAPIAHAGHTNYDDHDNYEYWVERCDDYGAFCRPAWYTYSHTAHEDFWDCTDGCPE